MANYRAGKCREAVEDGVAALALDPSNERAKFWLWLAAPKLGGYPPEVPDALRMEMKAGHEPTTLEFEDVAEQLGLDKTSGGRATAIFDFVESLEILWPSRLVERIENLPFNRTIRMVEGTRVGSGCASVSAGRSRHPQPARSARGQAAVARRGGGRPRERRNCDSPLAKRRSRSVLDESAEHLAGTGPSQVLTE